MNINTPELMKIRQREIEEDKIREEELKKNKNFVMLFRDNMSELMWLTANHPMASAILLFIMQNMDYRNCLACSYSVFEERFGKSKDTVRIAIKVLKDNGFIDVLKMGTSNVYIINQEVVWSSWGNQKKYAQFDGKILVSHKENKDYDFKAKFEKFKKIEIK